MIFKQIFENKYLQYFDRDCEIIFGESKYKLLDEAFYITDGKLRIMVRNKKLDMIKHHRSFKLKSNDILNDFPEGIPIIFEKITDNKGKLIEWKWEVDPSAEVSKRMVKKHIGLKQKLFIDKTLYIAGDDMIEYWKLDPKNLNDARRIAEIENKYNK